MVLIRISLGVVFFILGIAGLFLPFLQGWLFLLISAILFFPNHRQAQKVVAKCRVKFPRVYRMLGKVGIEDESLNDPGAVPPTSV